MIIEKLFIKNYRCYSKPIEIEFSGSGLTALVGPNNVGKSTVLKALDILLGDKWPQGQFSEDDFCNNNYTEDIVIACLFKKHLNIRIKENSIKIIGVVLRVKHLASGFGESSLEVEFRLLNSDSETDNLDFEKLDIATYLRYDGQPSDNPVYVSQEIKNQLPLVITIPLIKLNYEQPTNKWSVLGRMLQKVEKSFIAATAQKEEFEEKIKSAVEVLKIEEFTNIESDIKEFWKQMKPKNLNEADIKFLDFEPWHYYRQFKLSIEQYGEDVPIETLGEGVQRLAIIALYRSYLKRHGRNSRAILLIEEPESYLHPQARRSLFRVLKFAIKNEEDAEGQIIYTTHSEDFIDCGDFDNLVLLAQENSEIESRHIVPDILENHIVALGQSAISDLHIQYRLLEQITDGLKEALFTQKSIIVEGPSDATLFNALTDVEEEQVGIVMVVGKNNIPSVHAFLSAFGISCLVVADRDNGNNKKIAEMLNQSKANTSDSTKVEISEGEINAVVDGEIFTKERLLIFGKDLETVLTKRITGWEKLKQELKNTFKLEEDASKPRIIEALNLAYQGNYGGSSELEKLINQSKDDIVNLSNKLNSFIKQNTTRPKILNPIVESPVVTSAPDDIPF